MKKNKINIYKITVMDSGDNILFEKKDNFNNCIFLVRIWLQRANAKKVTIIKL